jgi:hypothetical protein
MKWIVLAVIGLLLNGTGLSFFGDAVLRKMTHPEALSVWFVEGTLSLLLVNAGVCCVIEGAISRTTLRTDGSPNSLRLP